MKNIPSLTPSPFGVLKILDFPCENESNINAVELSLVIPTYNESKNIKELIKQLTEILDKIVGNKYELIVVDDDSPDHTWEIAQSLIANYPGLKVIRRQGERGLATAVIRGWQVASGNILGVIDGDLQHPPSLLPKLLAAIDNAGVAVASRHIEGGGVSDWSLMRRIVSRGAQLLGLIILPDVLGRVSDPMSGYFLVRRNAIAGKILNPLGYKILIEILGRGEKRNIAEVSYVFQERQKGESKISRKIYIEYILHLLILRFSIGPALKFICFCLVGLSGVFVDMTILYLLSDPTTLGWGLTRSKIIAAEIAIINNFIWNDLWTFRDMTTNQRDLKRVLKRLLKFNTICLLGLCINVLVLNILFNLFGLNRYLANLIAIIVTTFWNFLINFKLNWRATAV